jgi:phage gp29-like protein
MSIIREERIRREKLGRYNPVKGLTPRKLTPMLDAYETGYLGRAALLWDFIEDRDLLIRNVASKRKKAVSRAQWEVLTIGDSPEAMQQKEVLEAFYNNLVATSVLKQNERGGMGLLQRQMMDAVGKGFAVHEIVWKPMPGRGTSRSLSRRQKPAGHKTGSRGATNPTSPTVEGHVLGQFMTAEFRFCPLWWFENTSGTLKFLENDGEAEGQPMRESDWLVTCGEAIMKSTSIAYLFKTLPLGYWLGYAEKFGFPGVHAKTSAARGTTEFAQVEAAVARFMNDFGCVTDPDTLIELIEAKGGGTNLPFGPLVEYLDRMIAALWRGADLSTISQGAAGVGASLQGEETNLLQEDDAGLITETFWDQIDKHVLAITLGVTDPLAYVKILPPKKQAVDQDIKIDEFLVRMGAELSVDDALERYGRGMAEDGAPVLAAQASSADGANGSFDPTNKKPLENSREANRLRQAKRELMAPVLAELRRIDDLTGDEQRNALLSLQAQIPDLRKRLENEAAAGDLADALAEEMKKALIDGFKKGNKTR